MTYSELEKNLIILTKPSEEELASALMEYLASSKKMQCSKKKQEIKIKILR